MDPDEKIYSERDMSNAIFREQYAFGTYLADLGVPRERRPKNINEVMDKVAAKILAPSTPPEKK